MNCLNLPRVADPPHPALICTPGTPAFDHAAGSGERGRVKVELCREVALPAVPRARFVSSPRVYTPLSCLCFSPRKVAEGTPSSSGTEVRRILNTLAVGSAYLSVQRHCVRARVNSQAILKAGSVTGFAREAIKKGGEGTSISRFGGQLQINTVIEENRQKGGANICWEMRN